MEGNAAKIVTYTWIPVNKSTKDGPQCRGLVSNYIHEESYVANVPFFRADELF